MKKFLLIMLLPLLVLWGAWFIAVPEDLIVREAEGALNQGELAGDIMGFRKGFFYNFTAEVLDIKVSGNRVFSVHEISGGLDFLPLLALKAVVSFSGTAGGGELNGAVELKKNSSYIHVKAGGMQLARLGFFELTGISGRGITGLELELRDNRGTARFSLDSAKLDPVTIMGIKIPLDMFIKARGALFLLGDEVEIESVSLEGEGIYARLTGSIRGRNLDAKLELMPDGDSFPDPVLNALLASKRISRGHYVIPIRTELGPLP